MKIMKMENGYEFQLNEKQFVIKVTKKMHTQNYKMVLKNAKESPKVAKKKG